MKLLPSTCFLSLMLLIPTSNASTLKDSILVCSTIKLNTDRLNCFDLISKRFNTKHTVKKSKEFSNTQNNITKQLTPIKKKENIVNEFGSSHLKTNKSKTNDTISLTLIKSTKTARKELVFFFENGQVWQQKGNEYFRVKPGDTLKLTKGSLGVIYMKKDSKNSKRKIRVKRIK